MPVTSRTVLLLAAAALQVIASGTDAISYPPSALWDGIDGNWSTFDVAVGTPPQDARVYPSWQSYQTIVVLPQGCPTTAGALSCAGDRGGLFNPNSSSTYTDHGFYAINIEEGLNVTSNAQYGFDTVTLGSADSGSSLGAVKNTTVAALALNSYYLGLLGLDPKPTNWTSFSDRSPSLMSLMQQQELIPSISFGYTAGASYRNVKGSLTLGGYDDSRLVENDLMFEFGSDNARYTLVNVRSINADKPGSSVSSQLLSSPITALIDTTIAEFWLPMTACQAFEEEFGLKYDQTSQLYLVDDALHSSLLARNASITFKLAPDTMSGATVDIQLPYAAFDLTAKPPYASLSSSSRYFPLRRAQNDTQYTLGRAFMQEAYVSVDYSMQQFNVSQAAFDTTPEILTIPYTQPLTGAFSSVQQGLPPNRTTPLKSSAIAGIAIGGIAAIVGLAAFLVWYFRRRQVRKRQTILTASSEKHASSTRSRGYFDDRSDASDDSRTLFSAGGGSSVHGSRIYAKYADSPGGSDTRSPISEDKLLSPYSPSAGSPRTPFSGRDATHHSFSDRGSVPKSAISHHSGSGAGPSPPRSAAPVMPSPVIWAGEKDSGQIFEMPGSVPSVQQADSKELSPAEASARRSPLGDRSSNRLDGHPSPTSARPSSWRSDAPLPPPPQISIGPRSSSMSTSSAAASVAGSRYSDPRFSEMRQSATPPRLNIQPAREIISSPVSALTPSNRRAPPFRALGGVAEYPVTSGGQDLGRMPDVGMAGFSPATARGSGRMKVYGTGDDEEYQSPAF